MRIGKSAEQAVGKFIWRKWKKGVKERENRKKQEKKKHPNIIQTIQTQILLHKFFENWLFRLVLHMP